jgi:hypothetical protein
MSSTNFLINCLLIFYMNYRGSLQFSGPLIFKLTRFYCNYLTDDVQFRKYVYFDMVKTVNQALSQASIHVHEQQISYTLSLPKNAIHLL